MSTQYNTDFHLFYVSGLVEEGLPASSLHKSTAWFCISKSHPGVILRVIRGSKIGPLWTHTATFMCDPHGEHSLNEAIDFIPDPPRLAPKDTRTEASTHDESVSTRDFAPTESLARASDDDDKNSIASSSRTVNLRWSDHIRHRRRVYAC
jgi:hypothetical protein